ncbi:MAG: hypothetical protein ACLSA6_07710 [Holdemania massiliensis]
MPGFGGCSGLPARSGQALIDTAYQFLRPILSGQTVFLIAAVRRRPAATLYTLFLIHKEPQPDYLNHVEAIIEIHEHICAHWDIACRQSIIAIGDASSLADVLLNVCFERCSELSISSHCADQIIQVTTRSSLGRLR